MSDLSSSPVASYQSPSKARQFLATNYYVIKRAIYQFIYPNVAFGKGVRIKGTFKVDRQAKVTFGEGLLVLKSLIIRGPLTVTFNSGCQIFNLKIVGNGTVTIGRNSSFNGSQIDCFQSVKIGDDCILSNCYIVDTNFHNIEPHLRRQPPGPKALAPIEIADNVWVGGQAVVMKGVHIGTNSVVGFGTIVRRDVSSNVVVIGNPQRTVKHLNPDKIPV